MFVENNDVLKSLTNFIVGEEKESKEYYEEGLRIFTFESDTTKFFKGALYAYREARWYLEENKKEEVPETLQSLREYIDVQKEKSEEFIDMARENREWALRTGDPSKDCGGFEYYRGVVFAYLTVLEQIDDSMETNHNSEDEKDEYKEISIDEMCEVLSLGTATNAKFYVKVGRR